MEWAEQTISRLRTLWDEGLSTAEIGRRLGVSKNAVAGKVHRLGLTERPSPIIRDPNAPPRTYRPARARAVTLAPLASVLSLPIPPTTIAAPPPRQPPTPRPAPAPVKHRGTCCWPLGEPGTKSFRYCDAPAVAGLPYCEPHAEIAYARPPARNVAA
jgi:GcrA cell cycle regulator